MSFHKMTTVTDAPRTPLYTRPTSSMAQPDPSHTDPTIAVQSISLHAHPLVLCRNGTLEQPL